MAPAEKHFWQQLKGGEDSGDFVTAYVADMQRRCVEGGNHTGGSGGPLSATCQMATRISDLRFTNGQLGSHLSHNYITPYTNPQSAVWDEDMENFMDEWTSYDIADPRWGTWDRCWPSSQNGRMGELPCPNTTYSWQQRYHRNETTALNAEAANDWIPATTCKPTDALSTGCQGISEQAAQYYRTPKKSMIDMMMHYHEKMLTTFAE